MYGYQVYNSLTEAEILNKVSEEEIFQIFIKEPIKLDKEQMYVAPYRNDTNPGAWFEYFEGQLQFVDFGIPEPIKKNNCFWFIVKCTGLKYQEALQYISLHFNLSGSKEELPQTKPTIFTKRVERDKTITYSLRKFTLQDKAQWEPYEITRNNLEEDKVLPIRAYRFQSKKGEYHNIVPYDVAYAYTEFDDGKVKIYRPNAPDKYTKWLTNCGINDVGSINHLPWLGEQLIITKSYKDCRVLRNQGLHSIWFQSEGMFPNEDIIKSLCKRFNKIFILWDNDSVGLSTGKILLDYINSIMPGKAQLIFLPPKLLLENIKDISDLMFHKKREAVLDFLTTKNIYLE